MAVGKHSQRKGCLGVAAPGNEIVKSYPRIMPSTKDRDRTRERDLCRIDVRLAEGEVGSQKRLNQLEQLGVLQN
jgi:hypothetical protein